MTGAYRRMAFTVVELLLVIGIIGLLASIVIVAVNPTKQLADAKEVTRLTDIRVILDAVHEFVIDHGRLPQANGFRQIVFENGLTDICGVTDPEICCFPSPEDPECDGLSKVNLVELIPEYLNTLPIDPENPEWNAEGTSYEIWVDENNHLTVRAPLGNEGDGMTLSR